jgi:hypothetical protein
MSQITELQIMRADRWATKPGVMSGKVKVEGENGTQEIRLSSETISAIFSIIRNQVVSTAMTNAKQVSDAIIDASAEAGLIENKTVIEGD